MICAAGPVVCGVDLVRPAGAVYVAAGLGMLKFLPGNPNNVADIVPVDTVVNGMLSAIPAIMNQVSLHCQRNWMQRSCSTSEFLIVMPSRLGV